MRNRTVQEGRRAQIARCNYKAASSAGQLSSGLSPSDAESIPLLRGVPRAPAVVLCTHKTASLTAAENCLHPVTVSTFVSRPTCTYLLCGSRYSFSPSYELPYLVILTRVYCKQSHGHYIPSRNTNQHCFLQ